MSFTINRKKDNSMKKSVDDLLTSTQDVMNQAIQLTTQSVKRSPSPSKAKIGSSADSIELISRPSTSSESPEISLKSQNEAKDTKKIGTKVADRAKKRAWYNNLLYPSYKSRSEEAKKLFNLSDDERLVVDYSCAIQKDILVHGRLYVSQNYLCFHANIIVYETRFVLRWKDVTSISKEKVAKVIPNAILVTTESEKYFLTSFTSRDKAYMILFRLWQNALMDKHMNSQELWQLVHNSYGEQLGLTSDDDYIDPFEARFSESEQELKVSSSESKFSDNPTKEHKKTSSSSSSSSAAKKTLRLLQEPKTLTESSVLSETCPTDMSDSSDSESSKKMDFVNNAECDSMHEGRQLVHTILPINIETVFGLMFQKSKFFTEFHKMRKTTDLIQGEWEDSSDSTKKRVISLTVAITQVVGPKSSNVTETQIMRSCSIPGQLYSIDATSVNQGIPYADSFVVLLHYCMKKTVDDSTVMSVHAQIKYKKSVWGVIKGFIEKNTWLGLEEFYEALSKSLMTEYCLPRQKGRRTRKGSAQPQMATNSLPALPLKQFQHNTEAMSQNSPGSSSPHTTTHVANVNEVEISSQINRQEMFSWVVILLLIGLIAFNVILYVKLWRLDENHESSDNEFLGHRMEFLRNPPNNPEEWLRLLQVQEQLHSKEMKTWQKVIQSSIDLLRKTEQSLSELQNMILTHRAKNSAEKIASVAELFTSPDEIS